MPSGGTALALLAIPRNGAILRQLSDGPMSQGEMQRDDEVVPRTTQRKSLKGLEDVGLLFRRGRDSSPGLVEHLLTDAGEDLLVVIAALEDWLGQRPKGSLPFESVAGGSAIKSLSDSWSATLLQTMAPGPISLGGLATEIRTVSYPSVARRLSAMRVTGQVEACPDVAGATPYAVTEWMQRSVAPLAAAVHWEQLYPSEGATSIARLEIETSFLLALPLLQMKTTLNGTCRMDVEMDGAESSAGASALVTRGRVVSSALTLDGRNDAWAIGARPAWATSMTSSTKEGVRLGGNRRLARGAVDGLRGLMFDSAPPS